jgi:hypothetical protein
MAFLALASCGGMNDNIEEYLARGEVNYLGKVDSVQVTGGRERVRITWQLNSDPRIEDLRVYWNDKDENRDSTVFAVDRSALVNGFMSVTLDVPEGYYIFNLYHTGAKGYRSVGKEVTGRAYGSVYQSTLSARQVKSITEFVDRIALAWDLPGDGEARSVLHYVSAAGEPVELVISPGENRTVLTDYTPNSIYTVTSYYLPEPDAPDEFDVTSDNMELKDEFIPTAAIALNKNSWNKVELPGDNYTDYGSSYRFELVYDGVASDAGWNTQNVGLPISFTLDLGVTARLSYHRLWHVNRGWSYGFYLHANPQHWKVYGAETIDESKSDSYWEGDDWKADWVLLSSDCEVFKPSGRYDAAGAVTDDDQNTGLAGFRFDFATYPPVRYIRFVVDKNFGMYLGEHGYAGGNPGFGELSISEISFWGVVVE